MAGLKAIARRQPSPHACFDPVPISARYRCRRSLNPAALPLPLPCAAPQDLVALSGAHTVGFAEVGFEQTFVHNGVWRALDKTPELFDNSESSLLSQMLQEAHERPRMCAYQRGMHGAAANSGLSGAGNSSRHGHTSLPLLAPCCIPTDYFQRLLLRKGPFTSDTTLLTNWKTATVRQRTARAHCTVQQDSRASKRGHVQQGSGGKRGSDPSRALHRCTCGAPAAHCCMAPHPCCAVAAL